MEKTAESVDIKAEERTVGKVQTRRGWIKRKEKSGEVGEEYVEITGTNGRRGWAICIEIKVRSSGIVEEGRREIRERAENKRIGVGEEGKRRGGKVD